MNNKNEITKSYLNRLLYGKSCGFYLDKDWKEQIYKQIMLRKNGNATDDTIYGKVVRDLTNEEIEEFLKDYLIITK